MGFCQQCQRPIPSQMLFNCILIFCHLISLSTVSFALIANLFGPPNCCRAIGWCFGKYDWDTSLFYDRICFEWNFSDDVHRYQSQQPELDDHRTCWWAFRVFIGVYWIDRESNRFPVGFKRGWCFWCFWWHTSSYLHSNRWSIYLSLPYVVRCWSSLSWPVNSMHHRTFSDPRVQDYY